MDRKKRHLYRAAELALLVALAVGVVLALQARAGSAWPATTRSQKPLAAYPPPPAYPPAAAYPPPPAYPPAAAYPPPEGPGMWPTASPTTPAATAAPRPTPKPTWDVFAKPTLPPATPEPVTYSLTSTDDWSTYTNTGYKFSLKYPETLPKISIQSHSTPQWIRVSINIRTGPTVPASYANRASFEIHIYPNPERLPLRDFMAGLEDAYGKFILPPQDNQAAKTGQQYLEAAGADTVLLRTQSGDSRLIFAASYQDFVYVFGEGFMTQSEAQSQVYRLVLSSFRFLDR